QDKGADRTRDITDAVSRKRSDDCDGWILRGEEDLREDERRRRRIDEEVIIFERGSDPAARRRSLRLTQMRRGGRSIGHGCFLQQWLAPCVRALIFFEWSKPYRRARLTQLLIYSANLTLCYSLSRAVFAPARPLPSPRAGN